METSNTKKTPFLERHPTINTMIGIAVLLALCVGGYYAVKALWRLIAVGITRLAEISSHLDAVIIITLITGAVSLIGVIISSVVSKIIDFKKSRQDYLAKKREQAYEAFIGMVYKILDSSNEGKRYPTEEMIKDMQGFSQELTLWGSKIVVRKWEAFRTNATSYNDPKDSLVALESIMNEMRRDMGTGKVKKLELLKLFVNDIE